MILKGIQANKDLPNVWQILNGPDDENDCFKQPHIAIE